MAKTHLLYGDNLDVMRTLEPTSVDTIYMDPPYNNGHAREYRDTFTQEPDGVVPA